MVEPFESEESIFADALEISSPAERAAFLDRACAADHALRAGVEALLRAHERSGDLLDLSEKTAVMADNVTERPGMIIGPYKLLEQIGEGGFAVVFMAEQTEPVRRKVALKILKPGMDSKQVIARFEVERQALALMDHRNIARVLDAGQAKSGRPYFVMDLVKGLPITEYCDQHQLAPRERLKLFIDVCQAVQHAHQKGIIHRDLKPSNVLVTVQDGAALVKVIDFGIAKALYQPLTDKTLFTGFAQMVGTPLYMSPEQTALSNVDADTRSDIYSLGVLLYEMLTGTTPFDKARLRTAGYDEIRRIIREEEPPRPSTRLSETWSAANAGQSTINDPVRGKGASPSTLRTQRFYELDWVVMKCLEKDRNRRYETAIGLARDIERYLDDEPVQACPPSAIYRFRKFVRRNKGAVLSIAAIFLLLIGGIAGTTWGLVHAENAREAEAIERYLAVKAKEAEAAERLRAETALKNAAREAAIAAASNDFLNKDLLLLVSPFEQLSHGVTPDANLRMRTVLQLAAKRIDGKFPNEPDVEMQLRYTIGYALYRVNDNRGAMAQCQKIVPYFQQTLGQDHPKTIAAMYLNARLHFRLKQYDIALPLLEQSLEKHKTVHGPFHAQTFNVMNVLSIAYSQAGHQEKALQLAKELLELRKQHLAPSHGDTLVGMNNVAYLYQRQGDVAKALSLFEETLHAMQSKFPPLHPETVNTKRNLAHAYFVAEMLDKAVPMQEAVVREYKTVHGIDDLATQGCIDDLLNYYVDIGWCDKADALLPSIKNSEAKKAQELLREIGHRTLIQGVRPSADKYQKLLAAKKADHPDTLAARQAFALVLRSWLRLSGAAYHLKAVLDARQTLAAAEHLDTHVCRLELGTTRLQQRKYADAEPLLLEAYGGLKRNAAEPRLVQSTLERLVQLYESSNQRNKADEWRKKLDDYRKRRSDTGNNGEVLTMFWDSILTKLSFTKPRRRAGKHRRLGLEILEDRLAPAAFSQNGAIITLALNSLNEAVHVHAISANQYAFSSTNNFSGTVNAPSTVTGVATPNATLFTSGVTQIKIVDSVDPGVAGGSVTFDDSGASPYAESIVVILLNANAGAIQFNGTSTFNTVLVGSTPNNITLNAGSTVNTVLGVNLQAKGTNADIILDGTLVTTGGLTIKAGRNISQTSNSVIKTASTTDAAFTLTGSVGDILLDGKFNDFAGTVTFGQSSSGTVRDVRLLNTDPFAQLPSIANLAIRDYALIFENTDIRLPAGLSISGGLTVSAGSGITEAGPITAASGFFAINTNGSIQLDTAAGNNISGTVKFDNHKSDNATTVAYTGAAGVVFDDTLLGLGTFTVKALGGNITETGKIVQKRGAGAVNFIVAGAGNTVTLDDPDNDFEGKVTIAGPVTTVNLLNNSTLAAVPTLPPSVTNLTLNFPKAPAVLPNLNLANLTVDAQGLYQSAGSTIVVSGNADLDPLGKALLLTNAGNDFTNIRLGASGPNPAAITDASAINFGGGPSEIGNSFIVTAGGAITQSSDFIKQFSASGRATFTAGIGAAITLDQSNNINGVMTFHTIGAGGNVTIRNTAVTPVTLGTSNIGGNLTVNASVKQDPGSTLTVGGNTKVGVANATCTLDNIGNVFVGSVAFTGNFASVRAGGPLVLGASNVGDQLTVHAGGAITQSSAFTVGSHALFDAGTAAITLTNSANAFGTLSVISTGAAPVAISAAALSIDRLKLGSGALTITCVGRLDQDFEAGGITQTAATPLTFNTSGVIQLSADKNKFLGAVSLPSGGKDLNIRNQGDISFVGTPALSGSVQLNAGGFLTLPAEPLTNLAFGGFVSQRITVSQNLTATTVLHFFGGVNFVTPGITLNCPSIDFNGDVNPAGALAFDLGANGNLTYLEGTWNQGANPLTIRGSGVFNIGTAFPSQVLVTFSVVSGTITMTDSANIVVNTNATFKVGGTTNAETVTVDSNAGNITFLAGSTLSVGLGATNDKLVKAAGNSGNIILNSGARLTSYAGLAGAAPSPVLAAGAGIIDTTNGFFNLTVDPRIGNAPHAFLMGTDIVQPNYAPAQLTIASGGTLAANGSATGFQSDGDLFTLQAVKTGTTTGVPLIFAENVIRQIDIVIRNAADPTTLTVTTTRSLGDGFTRLGGIAVNGPGTVVIKAPTSDASADILIAGPLASLTLRDFFNNNTLITAPVIRAGGTSAGATTITGRSFRDISIDLPTVLSSLAVNNFGQQSSNSPNFISAERFGTIKSTPVLAAGLQGDFLVPRLTNFNRANSALPAITSVTVGGTLGSFGNSAWDIAGNIASITAAATQNWNLGAGGFIAISNARNHGKLRNIGVLNLGNVSRSSVLAVGKIFNLSATNWVGGILEAGVFGNIKIAGNGTAGNLGRFDSVTLTATSNSGLSTVTGVPSFEALASLSVAGDSDIVTVHLLDGNATSIAVARTASHWNVTADVTPRGGAIAKLIAGNWSLNLDAKTAGTIAALGNIGGVVVGDFAANIVLHGSPGFTGVTLGTLKASRDIANTSVLVENGSITAIAAGRSMHDVNVRAIGAAGAVNSITAAEWTSTSLDADELVARNIGALTITGAPMPASGFGFLPGDFENVNVLTFLNGGATPAIATLSVAGDYVFDSGGFLRADNGITTFKVGRQVRFFAGSTGSEFVSLLNSSATSDVPGRIASLTVGKWSGIGIAAKTLGTVKATGFLTPQNPSLGFTPGDFSTTSIGLFGATNAPLVPHVGLDSLTANQLDHVTLSAPFGITSLIAASIQGSTINADHPPTGTAGRIALLQAAAIDETSIRAVSIGTLKTVPNAAAQLTGDVKNTDVTVTGFTGPATAPVAVGTVSISGNLQASNTFNIPHSINSFAVGKFISNAAEIAAGFAANSRIASFSAPTVSSLVLTSRAIGTMNVTGNFSSSLVTLTGNLAGVALGTFTASGQVAGSTFNITGGNVTSFITGAFIRSRLLVGFQMPKPGDIGVSPFPGSNWLSGSSFTLGTFKTTGLFDPANIASTASFRDSYVVAQKLGTIVIAGLDPNVPSNSTSFRFGIAFRVTVGSGPIIKVNGLNKSGFTDGDFAYVGLGG